MFGNSAMSMRVPAFAFAVALVASLLLVPSAGDGAPIGSSPAEATHAPHQYDYNYFRRLTQVDGCGSSRYVRFAYRLRARAGVASAQTGYEWNSARSMDGHWYNGDIFQGDYGDVSIAYNLADWSQTYFYCAA